MRTWQQSQRVFGETRTKSETYKCSGFENVNIKKMKRWVLSGRHMEGSRGAGCAQPGTEWNGSGDMQEQQQHDDSKNMIYQAVGIL